MSKERYLKLKARLMGSLHNALDKDPHVTQYMLEKVFYDSCKRLKLKGKIKSSF